MEITEVCSSHFCRVRVTSPSSQSHLKFYWVRLMPWSSRVRVTRTVKSLRVIGLHARVNLVSHEISRFFYDIFLLWNGAQNAINGAPISLKMVPNMAWNGPLKLENGTQCCFNQFDCRLFITKFSQFCILLVSFTLGHFKESSPTFLQVLSSHSGCLIVQIRQAVQQRWARTGSGLDILQDTCDFFGSGLDLDIDFWKKMDQDRITIFVWFLQRNFPESDSRCRKWWCSCFLCYDFYTHKKSNWFCQ